MEIFESGMDRLAALIVHQNTILLSPNEEFAARLCLLDTLGAGLYGSIQPEAKIFTEAAKNMGSGPAFVLGRNEKLEVSMSAMVNGALCHLRELDDVHYAILHTGCVCIPAALAVAQAKPTTLGKLLRAIVNGVEVTARVALGMDYMDHRERGWHGTATCGAFGSAAAASYLLDLNQKQMADAMGLAGSRTGGTWAFSADGSMSKRLHPGLAARDGVVSAFFAKAGVPGPHYVLESLDGGFYRVFTSKWDLDRALEKRDRLEIENVEFKYFASCKSVHSPISAALEIYKDNPQRKPEEISKVTVEVNRSALSMAGHSYEEDSVVSAQISIPYGVALGLLGRKGQAEDYELSCLEDPVIRKIADSVDVIESNEFNILRQESHLSGARVRVEWTNGTSSEAVITSPKGSIAQPMTKEEVVEKFMALAGTAIGNKQAECVCDFIMDGTTDLPTSQLISLITPENSK